MKSNASPPEDTEPVPSRPKNVVVFGAFDVLHPGHRFFLSEAGRYGNVTAIIARDDYMREIKGVAPHNDELVRLRHVMETELVTNARLGDAHQGTFTVLEDDTVDFIVLGHDQEALGKALVDFRRHYGLRFELVMVDPYRRDKYSSTKIRAMRSHKLDGL